MSTEMLCASLIHVKVQQPQGAVSQAGYGSNTTYGAVGGASQTQSAQAQAVPWSQQASAPTAQPAPQQQGAYGRSSTGVASAASGGGSSGGAGQYGGQYGSVYGTAVQSNTQQCTVSVPERMIGEEDTPLPVVEVPASATEPYSTVKETVLKKRKRDEQWAVVRQERQGIAKARARSREEGTFKRAEQYVKDFRQQERDLMRLQRETKKLKKTRPQQFNLEQKLLFVIRIRGTTDMHPKTRKILQVLRLRQIFFGVFMLANEGTISMLQKVEPYVTYGYPNMNTVRDLIYKRGHAKVKKERTSLTDNTIIEKALGKYDIICIADLINEIYNIGPHFKEATAFLWPFKLSPPPGGGTKPGNHFIEVSDAGNRADRINDLISQMN